MSDARGKWRHLPTTLLLLSLPTCGGGGGGGGGNPVAPSPPPPTTTPPAAGKPTLKITTADPKAGKSPLNVAFDLCESVDGGGGKSLTYLADFEGQGYETQTGCMFSHRYRSGGVTVYETKLAVRGAGGQQDEASVLFKAYVDVSINVASTPCNKIAATADLLASAANGVAAFGGVRAMAEVDRVQFEAFDAAGKFVSAKEGSKESASRWASGDWSTSNNNKLRVRATVYAQGVAGNDTPEQNRPGCP